MATNKKKIAEAGNHGPKIRSDCQINIEIKNSGGLIINLESKVKTMYGASILDLIKDIFKNFGISNAVVYLTDNGSLPFVLAARTEAAIKNLIDSDKEYIQELIPENMYSSEKGQFRFSRLYLPGNTPSMMINAGIHKPNGIILDLEDSVAHNKKHEARFLVRNALRQVNFYGAERMVRINQLPAGLDDLKYIVPHNVNMILIPKCESAKQIIELEKMIEFIKKKNKIANPVWLMPIIESALGVEKAYEIASASDSVAALAIGLEDYTADLGTKRTKDANESFYARTRIVNACVTAGVQPIDSVFSDVGDEEGLIKSVKTSKSLGFVGMGCIHPRQIKVIHESYAPDEEDINKAQKIVNAFYLAEQKGLGVVSLGTKMIDPPVVKRAEHIINLAVKLGLLSNNWRKNYEG
ncbi:aldolase/citrate lyase family protein [Bacteroidota bacterium]